MVEKLVFLNKDDSTVIFEKESVSRFIKMTCNA